MKGQLFYNAGWHAGSGEPFTSINPANEAIIWTGNTATETNINDIVDSARTLAPQWAARCYDEREQYIIRFAEQLKKNESALSELIAKETGKPLWEAATEAKAMQAKVTSAIKSYQERTGHKVTDSPTGGHSVLSHRPHGVLTVFGPYNFPGHLPNGHIVPALLAGNTIVFKPSSLTPAVGEFMVNLWIESGLPAGVVNLVQGKAGTGKLLASHPDIDGLLFTGSSQTGHLLHQQFGGQPEKILALEMGGNNPLIVDDSVDIRAAVYSIIQSAFITSGQRCTCARRLFIPNGDKGDALLNALIKASSKLKVGLWNDQPQPFMGPLVSSQAADIILNAQNHLKTLGGKELLSVQRLDKGDAWLSPGIMDVTNITALPDDEYFGPFLQVLRYDDFASAVKQANNTRYGLSAGLFSHDKEAFNYFYQHIRAGIVNWNRQTTGAAGTAPFGGIGASGNHRPSAWYAADYCAYPVASMQSSSLDVPETLSPGIII